MTHQPAIHAFRHVPVSRIRRGAVLTGGIRAKSNDTDLLNF